MGDKDSQRDMKSLLISGYYFPPQKGGISHFMASIATVLGPDRVCVLTSVPANGSVLTDTHASKIYRRPLVFSRSSYLQPFAFGASISQILLRERPRFVQLASAEECSLGLWLNHWFRLPFVIYAHGNEILSAIRATWSKPRLALRRATRILANSRYTANLVKEAGVHADRVTILHPGCDVTRFCPKQLPQETRQRFLGDRQRDRIILTVGGLVSRKGHDMVIRALPLVREAIPDVTYLIVGDGPNRGYLDELAKSIGVRDHVNFLGQISDQEMPNVYALCDVFVMPGREQLDNCDVEGFGLVYLEANACGKPVIGGRSGGIPDAVLDDHTGLLVDPHDPQDTARAIRRLLINRELASKLSDQGRSRVLDEFSLTRMREKLLAIFDSIGSPELRFSR